MKVLFTFVFTCFSLLTFTASEAHSSEGRWLYLHAAKMIQCNYVFPSDSGSEVGVNFSDVTVANVSHWSGWISAPHIERCNATAQAAAALGKGVFVNLDNAELAIDDGTFSRTSKEAAPASNREQLHANPIDVSCSTNFPRDSLGNIFQTISANLNGKSVAFTTHFFSYQYFYHKVRCQAALFQAIADRSSVIIDLKTAELRPALGYYSRHEKENTGN